MSVAWTPRDSVEQGFSTVRIAGNPVPAASAARSFAQRHALQNGNDGEGAWATFAVDAAMGNSVNEWIRITPEGTDLPVEIRAHRAASVGDGPVTDDHSGRPTLMGARFAL